MNKFVTALTITTALVAGGTLMNGRAEAVPLGAPDAMRAAAGQVDAIQNVQVFYWHGRRYCWYDDGWHGPGFYWCGYAWRSGIGWGGGWGWHGWRGGHRGERHEYRERREFRERREGGERREYRERGERREGGERRGERQEFRGSPSVGGGGGKPSGGAGQPSVGGGGGKPNGGGGKGGDKH